VQVSGLLERQRREIDERIAELRPIVEEYERLQAALAALTGPERSPSTSKRATKRRAGIRSRTSSKVQALSLVAQRPGITIPEMAAETDITQNYLYKMLPALRREGRVAKRGRGWHVTGASIASDPVSIIESDEVWCPRHKSYHRPPVHS
jgi:hypothetical protein